MARTKPSYQHIWKFKTPPTFSNDAPELVGWVSGSKSGAQFMGLLGSSNVGKEIDPDVKDYNYVNVSKEFTWTLNNEREEVPRIILKEMEFATSSMMQQATYQLTQFADPFTAAFTDHDPIDAYEDIYVTYDSGFIYDLPYFGDGLATGNNAWNQGGEAGEKFLKGAGNLLQMAGGKKGGKIGAAGKLLSAAPKVAGMIGGVREFVGGGAGFFVEQPKFYQHGNNNKKYTVTFPLYNTGDIDDLVRNFQLAFMLVYQNNPNRESKQLIRPPAIYELTIPGVAYCPYVQMSTVAVQFLGARRELDIPIPFEGGEEMITVRSIVPEAYLIQLSIDEMVGTTRNFMYHNLKRKINTGTR